MTPDCSEAALRCAHTPKIDLFAECGEPSIAPAPAPTLMPILLSRVYVLVYPPPPRKPAAHGSARLSSPNPLDLGVGIRPIQRRPLGLFVGAGPRTCLGLGLPLLGRLALCAPGVDAGDLGLEGAVDEAVAFERVEGAELWGHDEGREGLAAAACLGIVNSTWSIGRWADQSTE